jgi:hypothetical protein
MPIVQVLVKIHKNKTILLIKWNLNLFFWYYIVLSLHSSSSSLPGSEAYASAAPQPAGLLYNPDLDVPALATSLLYEILAARVELYTDLKTFQPSPPVPHCYAP